MVTQDEAFVSAREFLARLGTDYTPVLQPEDSYEHPIAWLVVFDSQEHLDTGDLMRAPFTRLLVVPKDGSGVHFPPTYLRPEVYLEELAAGEWPEGPLGRYKRGVDQG
ncbi:YrhB domain-containing protein [Streptomyces fuscigenes]|uniref:YrhB domain-containing protein n=1 Tax=Streptomyces fuscigenes TaxID=1528880 RepID=UPI001F38D5EA|nr:YrhB domain-containing protein [Streptomyces fuscigenes]MCF3961375.1 YrhB family protein [Streptomyces fuscigenes]